MKKWAAIKLTIVAVNGSRLLNLANLVSLVLKILPNHDIHFAKIIKETVSLLEPQEFLVIFVKLSLILKLLSALDLFETIDIGLIDVLIDVLLQNRKIVLKVVKIILI